MAQKNRAHTQIKPKTPVAATQPSQAKVVTNEGNSLRGPAGPVLPAGSVKGKEAKEVKSEKTSTDTDKV